MKLTINIKDHKAAFFLELLQNFEDFISIEETEEDGATLKKEHKILLDKRLKKYKKNPENLMDWEDARKEFKKKI